MSDSFQGTEHIDVQPGDVYMPIRLKLNPASATTAVDGSIPYGSTLVSATVTAHNEAGTATTHLVAKTTENGNAIIAYLSYSTNLSNGIYHLTARATISISGSTVNMVREFDLNRIYVKDR